MSSKKSVALKNNIKKTLPLIKLESIQYSEYLGNKKEWVLEEAFIENTSLIVGKNASGKSRFLNVISSLSKLLTGEFVKVFENAEYCIRLSSDNSKYIYTVSINKSQVEKEELILNDKLVLKRGKNGIGEIWAHKLDQFIEFEAPPDQLAAKNRRDTIQHPFFEDLHTWALNLRFFRFGTQLGKDRACMAAEVSSIMNLTSEIKDSDEIVKLYINAFKKFGEKFDKCILSDLALLGYNCTDVGAEHSDSSIIKGPPIVLLFVKESDIKSNTSQINMSQGMFRALSLVIHFNYCMFCNVPRTILIDDIGEGLDYSRSQSLIKLLNEHAKTTNIQLIMTTNDRFVMNSVPLFNWGLICRKKSDVRLLNYNNSKKLFDEFEELGLNNFEFFSTGFFEEGLMP